MAGSSLEHTGILHGRTEFEKERFFKRMAALLADGLEYKIVKNRISTVCIRAISLDFAFCIMYFRTCVILRFTLNLTSDYTAYFLIATRLFSLIIMRY